ncbi:MAG TPA: hypothetical protein VKG80_13530 [Trebonia sp.]|nr:hypothetical protein [Trebonia sp.]
MGIDRQGEDDTGPRAADSLRSAPPDLPDIPNGPVAPPPAADDSAGSQTRAERFSEYKAKVEAEYRREAVDRGCDRVREVEETVVTPAMLRVEAEDPDRCLAGFDNRLKGKDRLAEKVTKAMEERGRTAEEALASVKDAIRYTFQYADEKYAEGVYADCLRLEAAGFQRGDRQGTWESEQYKGINSRWREPESGFLFEVQFHTQASFSAKQETHWAYEQLRQTDTELPDDEIRELRAYQREVSVKVPIPPGATEIPDYNYL